jgi:hypothetical protein
MTFMLLQAFVETGQNQSLFLLMCLRLRDFPEHAQVGEKHQIEAAFSDRDVSTAGEAGHVLFLGELQS